MASKESWTTVAQEADAKADAAEAAGDKATAKAERKIAKQAWRKALNAT